MGIELNEKRKRGRPQVMTVEEYKILRNVFPEIRTRRGMLNKHWELRAFKVIADMIDEGMQGLDYLANPKEKTLNAGILRELGRFEPDDIQHLAIEICQLVKVDKRTVRKWASQIRLVRLQNKVFSETVSEKD